jgi:hypothetical protein
MSLVVRGTLWIGGFRDGVLRRPGACRHLGAFIVVVTFRGADLARLRARRPNSPATSGLQPAIAAGTRNRNLRHHPRWRAQKFAPASPPLPRPRWLCGLPPRGLACCAPSF